MMHECVALPITAHEQIRYNRVWYSHIMGDFFASKGYLRSHIFISWVISLLPKDISDLTYHGWFPCFQRISPVSYIIFISWVISLLPKDISGLIHSYHRWFPCFQRISPVWYIHIMDNFLASKGYLRSAIFTSCVISLLPKDISCLLYSYHRWFPCLQRIYLYHGRFFCFQRLSPVCYIHIMGDFLASLWLILTLNFIKLWKDYSRNRQPQ